ncbi:MAG: hypothetical protein GYA14_14265, partial [Ignavibacteria bacterium]|nr:hypothetical protein [Ignavibacteria bacterium]
MKNKIKLILFLAVLAQELFAQNIYVSVIDTFRINPDNFYKISQLNIIPFSENIYLNNRQLNRNDYSISYQRGIISLVDSVSYSLNDLLKIQYQFIKVDIRTEYKKRSLVIRYDDLYADTIKVSKEENIDLSAESIFGRDLQKSGTLIR